MMTMQCDPPMAFIALRDRRFGMFPQAGVSLLV